MRVQIRIPEGDPLITLSIPVRITDINYGNHLGNDSMVSIIHEARMQFLKHHGFSEMNAGGTGLIMSDLAVQFKGESFYGDELSIAIYCDEISRVSFRLLYSVSASRDGKNIVIALAQTGMVCFDYEARKVAAVPDAVKAVLAVA